MKSSTNTKSTIKNISSTVLFLAIFIAGFGIGSYQSIFAASGISGLGTNNDVLANEVLTEEDLEPVWKVWNLLETRYVTTKDHPTTSDKIEGLIEGLTSSYNDPYTTYFNAEKLSRFNEAVEGGSFSGVGMEIGLNKDGLLQVVSPLKNSPAYQVGILAGDIIMQIDETNSLELSIDEALSMIRGLEGTEVSLLVAREGSRQPLEFTIVRENIDIPVLLTKTVDNVFVISIYSFSADLNEKFTEAIEDYSTSKTKGLVIDLRNNPGGYLNSAVELGSWFTPAGQILVREESERTDTERLYRSKGYKADILNNKPVAVLVNQGSASASEIVAGIFQDLDIAPIIGDKTFGKGSVQELIPLDNDTALKVTVARWFTPNSRSISEDGITPDVEIKDDYETRLTDEQLDRAIAEIL